MNAPADAAELRALSRRTGSRTGGRAPLETRFRATALSEWIKFRSLRSAPAVLLATAVVMVVGAWAVSAAFHGGWRGYSAADRAAFDPGDVTLRGIVLAQLLIGALGVMTVTGEYTSGLIRGTFIATPQRRQVVAMKALIFAVVVWAWCTGLSFAAFSVGRAFLTDPVPHVGLGDPGVFRAVLGGGLYLTAVGQFGLFIGVLVRRTAAALVALFGIMLVANVVLSLLPGRFGSLLDEYTPAGAGASIWHVVHSDSYTLGPWQGFALFAAYVAATAAAAFTLIRRRDV